ncbi:MAG: HAD family phosphatase [Gammaproteobacteria bacterium]|nr:HAD family phosphatase [Gammaproteobacteria bacterium]
MSVSSQNKFSAVLFDMDGLLLDTEKIALHLFAETIEKAGYKWSEEVGLQMIGRNGQDADALLSAHYGTGFSIVEIRIAFLKSYQEHLLEKGVPVKDGARELLNELRRNKIPCALVTSSRRRITNLKLQGAALEQYFPVQICGDEVSKGKPDPQCYLIAADKLGLSANKCLVLEDSAPGIEAALAAGMTAWWVPDKIPATSELQKRGAMVFVDLGQVRTSLFS